MLLAQEELVEQEKEAHKAINIWQDSCSLSEEKCTELEEKLNDAIDRLDETKVDLTILRSKTKVLEEENAALRARSPDRRNLSSDPLAHDISCRAQLQDSGMAITDLQEALKMSREALFRSEDVVNNWEGEWITALPCS